MLLCLKRILLTLLINVKKNKRNEANYAENRLKVMTVGGLASAYRQHNYAVLVFEGRPGMSPRKL